MPGPPERYPFRAAAGSFFLGGADAGPLPPWPPVLAYGANRSPEALAAKLPGARVAAIAARLAGWRAVHSAHVSPYGAVPATLVAAPGHVLDCHLLFLEEGVARLDASEPNYRRVRLAGLNLEADALGRVGEAEAYVSRHGVLAGRDGRAVGLRAHPQKELQALLGRPGG